MLGHVATIEPAWRTEAWFWATVLAAALPVVAVGAAVAMGPWMPGAGPLLAACLHWAWTPVGRMALAALTVLLAYPLVRGTLSMARSIAGTRRWLLLLRNAVTANWSDAYWVRVVSSGVAGRVELCALPLTGAWTVGLWRPRVVVATRLLPTLSPDEFEAVLHHEAHHQHRRHPLQTLIIGALRDGFGWVPAVTATADAYAASRGFAADADAEAARRCGAEALVSALGKCRNVPTVVEPSGVPGFTDLATSRLERLTGTDGGPRLPTPIRAWFRSVILTLVCSGLGVVVCGAAVR